MSYALVLCCGDPRLVALGAKRQKYFEAILGTEAVLVHRLGMVGMFANSFANGRKLIVTGMLRMALEEELGVCLRVNKGESPSIAGIASHHDCKGCPACDDAQKLAAVEAVENVGRSLCNVFGRDIQVVPLFEQLVAGRAWQALSVEERHFQKERRRFDMSCPAE